MANNTPMDKRHRTILRKVTATMVENMDVEEVLKNMSASLVFSDQHKEKIMSMNTREDRCAKFLVILPMMGAKAYDSFKEALQNGQQTYLADILTLEESKSQPITEGAESTKLREYLKQIINTLNDFLTSAKEKETMNWPESEVDESLTDSRDNEGLNTSLNTQTYPNNNEQVQSSNDSPQGEKHCQHCYDRKKEIDAIQLKVKELHDRLSQFMEGLKLCAIGLNGQTRESLEDQRTEEKQSICKNEKKSLETENVEILLSKNVMLKSTIRKNETQISELKDEVKQLREEVDQLCTHEWKSRTVGRTYVSLPRGDKQVEGQALDVLSHIKYKSDSAEEKEDSCCCVIDLGENYRLFPTQFVLRETKEVVVLQGKTDDCKWIDLSTTDKTKSAPGTFKHNAVGTKRACWVEGKVSAFRYFRIRQTDTFSVRSHCLYPFPGLELYGVLLQLD